MVHPDSRNRHRSMPGTVVAAPRPAKTPQMNACLRANKEKLSDGCRKVVEAHGG
jgi:hypothetical protein